MYHIIKTKFEEQLCCTMPLPDPCLVCLRSRRPVNGWQLALWKGIRKGEKGLVLEFLRSAPIDHPCFWFNVISHSFTRNHSTYTCKKWRWMLPYCAGFKHRGILAYFVWTSTVLWGREGSQRWLQRYSSKSVGCNEHVQSTRLNHKSSSSAYTLSDVHIWHAL